MMEHRTGTPVVGFNEKFASSSVRLPRVCLAVPGQVQSLYIEHGLPMGQVNFGGVVKEVCLVYLPESRVGDYIIVHVGFALSKIDEATALETLQTFAELGLLEAELEDMESH